MKKANALRLLGIVAVVVLASMTTGCLKATIAGKIEPDPLVLAPTDTTFPGKLTLTMTGWLAGGTFETVDVQFYNGTTAVQGLDITGAKVKLLLSPVGKTASVDLKDIENLTVPNGLFVDGALVANKAKFVVKPGTSLGLADVVIEVGLQKAN